MEILISTCTTFLLPLETKITTNESSQPLPYQSLPAIYGDRIVWGDERNGNLDIYMFTLASAEVPPLDDNETDEGDGTGNETEGTETQITTNESMSRSALLSTEIG